MNADNNKNDIDKIYYELVDKSNRVSRDIEIEPSKLASIVKGYVENKLISTTFKYFIKSLKDNDVYPKNTIFLVANNNGQVYEVDSYLDLPSYLRKDQTGSLNLNIEELGINPFSLSVTTKMNVENHGKEQILNIPNEYSSFSIPIFNENDELICSLSMLISKKEISNDFTKSLPYFELLFKEMLKEEVLYREKKDIDFLYMLTKNLYSTYDTNELLTDALKYMSQFYPNDSFELWLIQGYKLSHESFRLMNKVPNSNDIKDKAFIEGKLIINQDNNELAIPIRGRQGIYGVIYLRSKSIDNIFKTNFLNDIVEVIGHAFENSQLYEQSTNWIKRLELINSLTKLINNNLYKDEVINVVIAGLNKIYKNQSILFIEVDKEKKNFINIKSNLDQKVDSIPIEGTFLGLTYKRKEAIIIADSRVDYGLEDAYCDRQGYKSLILAPIFSEGEVIGILAVSSEELSYFSYDDLKFLQLLSQQFNLSLTNSSVLNKIQQLAITDYLTELFNRSYLDAKIKESQHADKGGTLLLFDLDDFKEINDTYGHDVGDKVLVQVAKIFKNNIRDEDVAARWGGEELAIYLPKINHEVAVKIAERIIQRVRDETSPRVTISCGVANWKVDDKEIDYLLLVHKADQALYKAKKNGKDQLIIYSD